ncbi:sensor histidine kinase [Lentzea roselyniae]|uniref:histidine kinase n=1 Tax=Lentzea roselyniae TaxID=531940 RepID=A0ABP7A6H0_9PSEU
MDQLPGAGYAAEVRFERGGLLRRATRLTAGLAIGGAGAFAELAFLICAVPVLLVPSARPVVFAAARGIAEFERRRIERYHGPCTAEDYSGKRALQYLGIRWLIGGLGAGVLVLILLGAATGAVMVWQMVTGGEVIGSGDGEMSWYDPITFTLFGTLLVFITLQGLLGVESLDRRLASHFLGPTAQEVLRRRVSELTVSRAEVVEAINEERRRIERDLHDGVQQRMVALGMLLGRASRRPDQAAELLEQARQEAGRVLLDLREVTWRVYPVGLDSDGLHAALESLAERCGVPVRLRYELTERHPGTIEIPAYFVASEAVTNVSKHARATRIDLSVTRAGTMVVVRIEDDGIGGADPAGSGLSGLARRVAAVDGAFTVDSPRGGPTVITAELPCAW